MIFLCLFCASFQDCGDSSFQEICEDCKSNKVRFDLSEAFAIFEINNYQDTTLLYTDSVTQAGVHFTVCNTELIKSVEPTKVLKISGQVLEPCDMRSGDLIRLDKIEVVEFCHPRLKKDNRNFPFFGTWNVDAIHLPDTVLLPPCELRIPSVTFEQEPSGNILFPYTAIFRTEDNSAIGKFNIEDNQVNRTNDLTITLAIAATSAGRLFENHFFSFARDTMNFTIENNVMTLQNTKNSSDITLYYKE